MTKNPGPIVRLAEVLTERRETPDPTKILSGEIPIVSKIGFDTGRIELRNSSQTKTGMILIQPGDLVLSGINAAKGAIAIYDKENTTPIAATIHYGAYTPNERKVDLRYLWHFFRSCTFQEILTQHMPGGIKTELKATRFLAVPVPLPSLSEQRRIVAKIDLLAAKIWETRGLKERSVSQTGSFIASVTENVLHSLLVNGTEEKTLESVCVRVTDGAHHTPKFLPTGVPLVMAANVSDNHLDLANVGYISDKDHEEIYRRAPVEKGDVLFINIGATTGTVKKIDVDEKFSIKNVALLKPNRQLLDSDYLVYFLRSRTVKDRIALKQSQTCQPFLSLRDLRNLTLPVPHLEDQRRIVAYLDDLQAKINKLKELQHQTAAELDSLLPSLLHKAFKGQL